MPSGETVASFESYEAAQGAVDRLAKTDFPVKELSIVGTELATVERITGKMSWGRAAGGGALTGAWFGTFMGLLLFIFSPTPAAVGILISAILIGAGFGMIFGLVSYSINRRRRDFTSTMQVIAKRYAILAPGELAHRARNLLGSDAAAPEPAAPRPAAPAPEARDAGGSAAEEPPAPTGLTYGEAQDAARRAARPRYGEYAEPAEPAGDAANDSSKDSGGDSSGEEPGEPRG